MKQFSGIKYRPVCLFLFLALSIGAGTVQAQIPRRLVDPGGPVDELFLSQNIVVTSSVSNLPAGNLNFTIMHVFGRVDEGVQSLWGVDGPANIRFGLDYGISDRLSIGVGRSQFDKLYDFRFKANLLRQSKDRKMPIELALKGDMGIMTESNGFEFSDRLNYLGAVMLARRMSDKISLQVSPMISHFNTVSTEHNGETDMHVEEKTHFAVALGGRILVNDRVALLVEYIPVFGDRTTATENAFAVALNIETGGHVFVIYLKTSDYLTEQHVIARNSEEFFRGDFRLGFIINRVFSLN